MEVTPETARAYLRKALKDAKVSMAAASRAAGHNHAYISQYLRDSKPFWLDEVELQRLSKLIKGLDLEQLREPIGDLAVVERPKHPSSDTRDEPEIDLPSFGELIKQPGALELLKAYGGIRDEGRRRLVLETARQMFAADIAIVA